jgi:hypothetical protein
MAFADIKVGRLPGDLFGDDVDPPSDNRPSPRVVAMSSCFRELDVKSPDQYFSTGLQGFVGFSVLVTIKFPIVQIRIMEVAKVHLNIIIQNTSIFPPKSRENE